MSSGSSTSAATTSPARFDDEAGHREPHCRARLGHLRTQLAGQQGQVQGRFTGPVGDAVAAAQVEFGQNQTVLFVQPGHEADKAPYGGQVGLDTGDL